jgi:hypothetical protein
MVIQTGDRLMSDPRKLIEAVKARWQGNLSGKSIEERLCSALEKALEERDEYEKADERSFKIIGGLTERAEAAEADLAALREQHAKFVQGARAFHRSMAPGAPGFPLYLAAFEALLAAESSQER